QPSKDLDLKKLGTEFTQDYLNKNYPLEKRNTITKLNISNKNLTGSLDLRDFVNLEELDCSENNLINLTISNYHKLKKNDYRHNQFTTLDIGNQLELAELDCSSNRSLTD